MVINAPDPTETAKPGAGATVSPKIVAPVSPIIAALAT